MEATDVLREAEDGPSHSPSLRPQPKALTGLVSALWLWPPWGWLLQGSGKKLQTMERSHLQRQDPAVAEEVMRGCGKWGGEGRGKHEELARREYSGTASVEGTQAGNGKKQAQSRVGAGHRRYLAVLKASDWLNLVKLECICETLILTQGLGSFDQTALTLFLWGQMIYIVLVLFKTFFFFFLSLLPPSFFFLWSIYHPFLIM